MKGAENYLDKERRYIRHNKYDGNSTGWDDQMIAGVEVACKLSQQNIVGSDVGTWLDAIFSTDENER